MEVSPCQVVRDHTFYKTYLIIMIKSDIKMRVCNDVDAFEHRFNIKRIQNQTFKLK